MTNLSSWAGGQLASNSLGFVSAFNSSDINVSGGLAIGASVLSTISFNNATGDPDQFMDISAVCALASSTITIGAGLSFWMYCLQEDGATYGDGRLVAGTPAVYTPPFPPLPFIPLQTGTTVTTMIGDTGLVTIRPRQFALVVQNNTGFALAATGNTISASFYKQNLNG